MHIIEINIKNRVSNYYFSNLVKAKKFEPKNILINEYFNHLLDIFVKSRQKC